MKFLMPIIFAFMLSGCFYQSVNNRDIQDAAIICGGMDKVQSIRAAFTGDETVVCNNRQQITIDSDVLKNATR